MLRVACAVAAAIVLAGCFGWGKAPWRPRELLPDLDQVAPYKLAIVQVDGRDRLVFASAVDNVGRGTLLLEARRERVTEPMEVRQLVEREDGSTYARLVATFLRYVHSETHSHWHLRRFERYELRRRDGTSIGRDRKTGFCLGDRYERRGFDGPREPRDAVWVGECGKGDPGALRVRQGISPGYGDDYDPALEGQYVDVTGLAPGRYVLVHTVDPERMIVEETRANNSASVLLDLEDGPRGPVVTVVRKCPDTADCR